MNARLAHVIVLAAVLLLPFPSAQTHAQSRAQSRWDLTTQARKAYDNGEFAEAERDFRELTRRDPSDPYAQFFLGQSFFRQGKFAGAVVPYEKARELETSGKKLTSDQHRILVDQLAIAYGMSGSLTKVRTLLEGAIRQDPDYPLNYYNLACAYAEEGKKTKVLANLRLAFQHKDHILKGEHMPDPRNDDSFKKYVHDEEFIKLISELGYN
jgi:predicted Zn-dependent protease